MRFTSQWRTTTESVVRLRKCARGSTTLGGYTVVVSHRSGETDEHDRGHRAGHALRQIKTGSLPRSDRAAKYSDRAAKYNELIHIAEELGTQAR